MWPLNSSDLNPVDYSVWSALERNIYRGRRFENTIELKEAILQEWEALPQAVINNAIDGFRLQKTDNTLKNIERTNNRLPFVPC